MVTMLEPELAEKGATLETILKTPEGWRILTCIQCGTCAGTCPYGEFMDYPPRRIISMLRRGRIEEVFRSDSMLRCVACYSCMTKCPRGIRLSDVLLPLVKEQTLAIGTGATVARGWASLDVSLQRSNRKGGGLSETGTTLSVGLTVRP